MLKVLRLKALTYNDQEPKSRSLMVLDDSIHIHCSNRRLWRFYAQTARCESLIIDLMTKVSCWEDRSYSIIISNASARGMQTVTLLYHWRKKLVASVHDESQNVMLMPLQRVYSAFIALHETYPDNNRVSYYHKITSYGQIIFLTLTDGREGEKTMSEYNVSSCIEVSGRNLLEKHSVRLCIKIINLNIRY